MAFFKVLIICTVIALSTTIVVGKNESKQKKYLFLSSLVCENDNMVMTVKSDSGFPADAFLTLNDNKCKFDPLDSTYITSYGKCGTVVEETDEYLIYRNNIIYTDISMNVKDSSMTRAGLTELIVLECKRKRRNVEGLADLFKPGYSVAVVTESRFGTFSVSLDLYKSATYQDEYLPGEYPVTVTIQDDMHLQLSLNTTLGDISITPQACYATVSNDPTDPFRHYIFKNRCGTTDKTFKIIKNERTAFQFSVESFDLIKKQGGVYLHCQTVVCKKQSNDEHCAFGCLETTTRRRREIAGKEKPEFEKVDFITVSSGFISTKTKQKLIIEQQQQQPKMDERVLSDKTTLAVLVTLVVVVVILILSVLTLYCKAKSIFIFASKHNNKLEIISQD